MTIRLTQDEVMRAVVEYVTSKGFRLDFTKPISIDGVQPYRINGVIQTLRLDVPIIADCLDGPADSDRTQDLQVLDAMRRELDEVCGQALHGMLPHMQHQR